MDGMVAVQHTIVIVAQYTQVAAGVELESQAIIVKVQIL
jgi:hypothetical protein